MENGEMHSGGGRDIFSISNNERNKQDTKTRDGDDVNCADGSGVFVIIIFFESYRVRVDGQEWRANIKLERFHEYIVEISWRSGLCLANSNLI